MLPAEVLKQIRAVQLKAGHLVTDALAGNYLSAFKGRGMEFDEVREYVPGDDVRSIDWNVTARMGAPYIKVLREERELTLMLMVDVSPSLAAGGGTRTRSEVAAELAAVLAFLAIRNNDKVGLLVFSDHVEQFIPPKKGRAHVWRIIREVLTHKGRGSSTDIGAALDAALRYVPRRSLCFLISDFWAQGFERAVKAAAQRHDLVAVRVDDPREHQLPAVGLVTLQDSESGELIVVDTSDQRLRADYAKAAAARERDLTSVFRREGIDQFAVTADGSVTTPLVKFLREREKRRRR